MEDSTFSLFVRSDIRKNCLALVMAKGSTKNKSFLASDDGGSR